LILETSREIQPASLPDVSVELRVPNAATVFIAPEESLDAALQRLERELIQAALERNIFSLTRTAEQLKLSRHSLRYRMQRLNMKPAGGEAGEAAGEID